MAFSSRLINNQLAASNSTSGTMAAMPGETPDADIVSSAYIKTLLDQIEKNFPKKDSIFSYREEDYPEDALKDPYISNAHKKPVAIRYNPFGLRLCYELQAAESLYKHTSLSDNRYTSGLFRTTAFTDYFNFIKVYNLAYISLLKALNGSQDAIERVKQLFSAQTTLFSDAKIKLEFLTDNIKAEKNKFVLALLAYLILEIVSSKDANISTDARIAALHFLKENFSLRDVATAYTKFNLGYALNLEKEPVYDLIPAKFINSRDERVGNVPHNKLFLENATIKAIFPTIPNRNGWGYSYKFDNESFSDLFSHYPEEAAQVLFSLLKIDEYSLDKTYIFMAILDIADFPPKKQEKILGMKASYRNCDEQRGLQIQLNSDEDRKQALNRRINAGFDDLKQHSPDSDVKDFENGPSTPKARAKTNAKEKALTPELTLFINAREKIAENKDNKNLSKIYKLDPESLNLMCCISYDFPEIPVYLKGRLYDYRSLEEFISNGFVRDIDRVEHPLDHLQAGFDAQRQMDVLFAQQEKIALAQAEAKVTDRSMEVMELVSIWQQYLTTLKEKSSNEANEIFNKCIIAASDQIRYAFLLEFVNNESKDVAFQQFLIVKYGKDLYLEYKAQAEPEMEVEPPTEIVEVQQPQSSLQFVSDWFSPPKRR